MEVLRSIKITVEVDTNKATYRETFDDDEIDVMFDWLKDYTGIDFRPTQPASNAGESEKENIAFYICY